MVVYTCKFWKLDRVKSLGQPGLDEDSRKEIRT